MKNMNKAGGRVGNPKLSFGYLYDFRNPEPWRRPWNDLYQETLDVVAWSETTGFRGAWVPEHHGADDGYMPTPNLALAAMAARTTTIRIGAAIAIAPLSPGPLRGGMCHPRHPVQRPSRDRSRHRLSPRRI